MTANATFGGRKKLHNIHLVSPGAQKADDQLKTKPQFAVGQTSDHLIRATDAGFIPNL